MGVNDFMRTLDVGAIRPTYGSNLDYILFGWIQPFQAHEDAFGSLGGYITPERVLHLHIPVVSIGSDQFPIAVDIRIPPRFPESDPQCKLVHRDTRNPYSRGQLPVNHPAISVYDYQIDLRKLASMVGNLPLQSYMPNRGVPSLVQLLAAISNVVSDSLESFVQQNRPSAPVSNQQQAASQSPSSGVLSPNVAYSNPASPATTSYGISPVTANASSNIPSASFQQQNTNNNNNNNSQQTSLTAPKEVHSAVSARIKEFFEQREAALKTLGHLQGSQDTLQRLAKSLHDKKSTLQDAHQEVLQMAKLCDQVVGSKPTSALKCIDASDQLSAQGFSLLAEVQACDDVMEALEKRLRTGNKSKNYVDPSLTNQSFGLAGATPGSVFPNKSGGGGDDDESPTTNYLRLVGNLARRQFMAKFLLRKVQGKRLATRSLASLVNRFPALDPSVISAVLESNAYDAAATAQRLTEMTRV